MLAVYGAVAAYGFGLLMNLWFWPFALGDRHRDLVRAGRPGAGEPAPLAAVHPGHVDGLGCRAGDHQRRRDPAPGSGRPRRACAARRGGRRSVEPRWRHGPPQRDKPPIRAPCDHRALAPPPHSAGGRDPHGEVGMDPKDRARRGRPIGRRAAHVNDTRSPRSPVGPVHLPRRGPRRGTGRSGRACHHRCVPARALVPPRPHPGSGRCPGRPRLAVGHGSSDAPRLLDLDPESFAAGPFGSVVMVGTDDGSTSRLLALDVLAGCVSVLDESTDVVRSRDDVTGRPDHPGVPGRPPDAGRPRDLAATDRRGHEPDPGRAARSPGRTVRTHLVDRAQLVAGRGGPRDPIVWRGCLPNAHHHPRDRAPAPHRRCGSRCGDRPGGRSAARVSRLSRLAVPAGRADHRRRTPTGPRDRCRLRRRGGHARTVPGSSSSAVRVVTGGWCRRPSTASIPATSGPCRRDSVSPPPVDGRTGR